LAVVKRASLALWLTSLLLTGCPGAPTDPPPPPRKPEIPVAPPHALGALAAGTDAAPRPYSTTLPGDAAEPAVPAPAPPAAVPDAGAPDAAPVPKAAPDAGMAL
jgi:hypothetical protein